MLAGQGPDEDSSAFLADVRRAHPHAKRAMLIGWGEWGYRGTGDAILEAIEHGRIDHYVVRPAASPDEQFHQAVSTFLLEWAEERRTAPYAIHVVGDSWAGRAYELRSVLESCAFPHSFSLADSAEGQSLLGSPPPDELPVVILPDGTTLTNPSDVELTRATGSSVEPEDTEIDLLIVGAGPAGLSAAVYGASEGFRTLVVDTAGIGGQARSSSMIRNYLGFPRGISGALLARHAYEQAWILGARFMFMQSVTGLWADSDRLAASLSESGEIRARAVVLATGADYRRLGVPALEALSGAGVFYGGAGSDANRVAGQDVYVLGGANSAGQAALHLARLRTPRDARRARLVARGRHVAVPRSAAWRDAERRRQARSRDRRRRRQRLADPPRASRPSDRRRGDGSGRRAVSRDRRAPAHRLAAGDDRRGTTRASSSPARTSRARRLAARARSVPARDEHARRPRRGRRAARLDQAGRLRGRRGLCRDPRPPSPARPRGRAENGDRRRASRPPSGGARARSHARGGPRSAARPSHAR